MKSVEIEITDITEGNRKAKFEQLVKSLNGGTPEYIPADNTPRLGTINIKLKDYSSERIEKALRTMAMSLSVPLKAAKGEIFFYKAQEDLTDKWCMFFSELVRNTYDYVTDYLDLPKKTVMSKSDILTHKGKILYNPSTGEPIKQSDWNKFVGNLEKYLNRNIKDVEKKIILESKSLSKILDRMLKYNSLEAVKNLRLEGLQYHGKSFDWISENVKNMQNTFGESLTRQEQARIEVMTQSAAQEITNITDKMRGNIKQILIDGVKGKRSKGQVSQALFDKMVGDNRDFQRVADTEIQNAFNNSFVQEEVYNTEEGKKTYFKRIEVIDGNTCPKCKAINGKIAVWSDKPLNDEKSKDKNADYVIWEGKDGFEWDCPISVKHPYCYSDDTEVMTNNGWKLFKDVEKTDRIMSINPDTKEIDFIPFIQKIQYEYNGEMVHFPGRNFDLLVTPNHNMLYSERCDSGCLSKIKAQDLIKKTYFNIPRAIHEWRKTDAKTIKFGDLTISKKLYFRLWAWYLAEGSGRVTRGHYEVKLSQKDPMKIYNDLPELQSILHVNSDCVCLHGNYARYFECMFGIYADKKFIPHFIKDSSVENIREFLAAFVLADGTYKNEKAHKNSYSQNRTRETLRTSSRKMADDLCEMIVKAGWLPSVYCLNQKGKEIHFKNGDYTLNTNCYNISICRSKYRTYTPDIKGQKPRHKPEMVKYNSIVYDVELEKWHFLLVRRNGKCSWSGNCRGTWQRYDIGLDNINIDALVAEQSKNAKKWNNAVKAAKEEYKEKGIENPDDSTKGFTERIKELYNGADSVEKSLTFSGHKLQGRTAFRGLNISIENKKGTIRRGVDSDGHKWAIKMNYDYGYIRGTEGVDGDHVDCYIGDNIDAKNVYIIHQKIPGTDKYDEDKCMLGFDTLADAKAAYLKQYDKPGFFGGVDTVPFELFKQKVLMKKYHGKKLVLN